MIIVEDNAKIAWKTVMVFSVLGNAKKNGKKVREITSMNVLVINF
jgi:hypothetical protein